MKFAMFFMAEYANMITVACLASLLFLGGWHGPGLPSVVWFLIKLYALIFVFIWVRWTYPRFRIDQLLGFSWKILIPVALLNLVVTAYVVTVAHR